MKLISRTLLVAFAALALTSTAFGQSDAEGSNDFPGITRMPNTFLQTYNHVKFDAFKFPIATVRNQSQYSPSRERDTSSVTTSSKVSNARVLYRRFATTKMPRRRRAARWCGIS